MDEKVAFITGGATGIGKRMAFSLADNGMSIIITYRKSKKAALALVDELQEMYHVKAIAIQGDSSSEEDCRIYCKRFRRHLAMLISSFITQGHICMIVNR